VVEERRAALALDDPAEIQEVRALEPEARAEPRAVAVGGHVDADAHDLSADALVPEGAVHQAALLDAVVGEGPC